MLPVRSSRACASSGLRSAGGWPWSCAWAVCETSGHATSRPKKVPEQWNRHDVPSAEEGAQAHHRSEHRLNRFLLDVRVLKLDRERIDEHIRRAAFEIIKERLKAIQGRDEGYLYRDVIGGAIPGRSFETEGQHFRVLRRGHLRDMGLELRRRESGRGRFDEGGVRRSARGRLAGTRALAGPAALQADKRFAALGQLRDRLHARRERRTQHGDAGQQEEGKRSQGDALRPIEFWHRRSDRDGRRPRATRRLSARRPLPGFCVFRAPERAGLALRRSASRLPVRLRPADLLHAAPAHLGLLSPAVGALDEPGLRIVCRTRPVFTSQAGGRRGSGGGRLRRATRTAPSRW